MPEVHQKGADAVAIGSSPAVAAPERPRLSASDLEVVDDEVVARVRGGDLLAFEILMRRHNRTIFRAARAILRSDDEAEDVMQHAYLRAFEHLGDYSGQARFAAWITRIAVYEALARLRRRKFVTPLDECEVEEAEMNSTQQANPEQRVSDAELRVITEAAIDQLPRDFRLVFVLRAVEQMSVADVAASLGVPAQTVKTRFFRARLRLQQILMSQLAGASETAYEFHLVRCDRVVNAVLDRVLSSR
ncbi:MAG TPA: RNA polymerase sigma factor [Polyangiaceae bacterium]|jgi:RNA polymerase sigma-70 factor (ECF subfamily)|nr:RNA polymerase sigma factor [Polyangiaceae bacterium]